MKKTFVETSEFTEWVKEYMSDDSLADCQRELLNDPETGSVMPGCGGLRKMRVADPRRGKGKRGGARVIYLHIEESDQIHLITVYGKDQKDDLSADDKRSYRRLVQNLKERSRPPEEM
ncbi:MAG: type II toxin-antitoxin system RelE/ParE family toxin [Isosphaerales bacterium]